MNTGISRETRHRITNDCKKHFSLWNPALGGILQLLNLPVPAEDAFYRIVGRNGRGIQQSGIG